MIFTEGNHLMALLGEWGVEPSLVLGEGRGASVASALGGRARRHLRTLDGRVE